MIQILPYKFGGSTTASSEANKGFILPKIEKQEDTEKSLYIFSAFGKTTNQLEEIYDYWRSDSVADALIDKLHTWFVDYSHDLSVYSADEQIKDHFKEFRKLGSMLPHMNEAQAKDSILAYGEIISLDIMHAFLQARSIPHTKLSACDVIVTNDGFGNAEINLEETKNRLASAIKQSQHKVFIIEGFIGKTLEGTITTLGREGSDITATVSAALLGSPSVTLFKNTKGVLDENQETIPYLSYDQALEIVGKASHVFVHPKCIQYARLYDMRILIKPYNSSNHAGTIIYKNQNSE